MTDKEQKRKLFGRLFGRDEQKAETCEAPAVQAPAESAPELASPEVVEAAEAPRADEPSKKQGWFARLKAGLTKTSAKLSDGITSVFTKRKLNADTLQDLEDLLIQADLGVETAMRITEALAKGRYEKGISADDVRAVLACEVEKVLEPVARPLSVDSEFKPQVIVVVGVNGTGKTTTIGKLAARYVQDGKKVMLAAADTFRAAAIDQLNIWGERTGAAV